MKKALAFLSLFTSFGTIVCCALPALFVLLGMGAAFAGLVGAVPQIVWLSEHKVPTFLLGGTLLALGGFLRWKNRGLACPVDPALGKACESTRDWSGPAYYVALGLYLIGAFFAFLAPALL